MGSRVLNTPGTAVSASPGRGCSSNLRGALAVAGAAVGAAAERLSALSSLPLLSEAARATDDEAPSLPRWCEACSLGSAVWTFCEKTALHLIRAAETFWPFDAECV